MSMKSKLYNFLAKKIFEPSMRKGIETGVGVRKPGKASSFIFNKVVSPIYNKVLSKRPKLNKTILEKVTGPAYRNVMQNSPSLQEQVAKSVAKGLSQQNPNISDSMAKIIADTVIKSGFLK